MDVKCLLHTQSGTHTRLCQKRRVRYRGWLNSNRDSKDWRMLAISLRKKSEIVEEGIDEGRSVDFALLSRQAVTLNSCLEEVLVRILALQSEILA